MKQYIVDTFTDKVFSGNPAAVCIMDNWIDDIDMMNIAVENNLSETAFAVKNGDKYKLRWFTPGGEIDLCGHATLACAYVIMNHIEDKPNVVVFDTLSGELTVKKHEDIYEMDFPSYQLEAVTVTEQMAEAIGAKPIKAFMGRDLLCVFDDEQIVKNASPNLAKVKQLDGLLLHITAQGKDTECVSRSFAPKLNVSEDPVCGSGHCHIVPFWCKELKKTTITAYQASKRGGILYCRMNGNRVVLGGKATIFSIAQLFI